MSRNNNGSTEACLEMVEWTKELLPTLEEFPFVIIQLQLLVIFVLTQSLHGFFFRHFGFPPLVSQIFAGYLLSPASMNKFKILRDTREAIFPAGGDSVWNCISMLGYFLICFMISIKSDFGIIRRSGRMPLVLGILAIIVPSIVSVAGTYGYIAVSHLEDKAQSADMVVISLILPLSSFTVIVILLGDMNLINSELGRFGLSTALVSELGSLILVKVAKSLLFPAAKDYKSVLIPLAQEMSIIGLALIVIYILRPCLKWVIQQTPKGRPIKDYYLILIFFIMLLAALMTNACGQFVFMGATFVGLGIPDGPPLGSAMVEKFDCLVTGILQPFYITTTVMKADVGGVGLNLDIFWGQFFISFVALALKILICFGCGLSKKMIASDALALGFIMSTKGVVELGIASMFKELGILGDEGFAFLILFISICATVVPFVVKLLYHPMRKYAGYQARNVQHCKENSDLRILACISRQDNVASITNLLNLSCPTKQSPMVVYVLHLIKQVGRFQPIFISHDLQKKKASNLSYSEDIIWAFERFRNRYVGGFFSVHVFTAMTPAKAMHDEICTLALDKVTSLIVLPFHRKMTIDGSIESEDHGLRALNKSVLDRAPCSVAILIDRGHSKTATSMSNLNSVSVVSSTEQVILVAVIFIGGDDDQEALAFAKRMAKGLRTHVTLVRIKAIGDELRLKDFMEETVLVDFQEMCNQVPYFSYVEKSVKDGAETLTYLETIIGDFNLIIVGRRYNKECRQTLGLTEWTEMTELGTIGDWLASPDHTCKTTILVVQQQKQWTLK